ncbi:hypothetical protein [Kitasatospora sp. NPDC056184]
MTDRTLSPADRALPAAARAERRGFTGLAGAAGTAGTARVGGSVRGQR